MDNIIIRNRTTNTVKHRRGPGSSYFELPSMEEVAEGIEKQRSEATAALEISEDRTKVRCQGCGNILPMITDDSKLISSRSTSMRIAHLQAIIKQAEKYHIAGGRGSACKNEREELAVLLEEERKSDFFRRLPLLNSEVTNYKWFCSTCYDVYYYWMMRAKKEMKEREGKERKGSK